MYTASTARPTCPRSELLDHLEGYAGFGAGADRQWRRHAAPAGHLRRAHRLRSTSTTSYGQPDHRATWVESLRRLVDWVWRQLGPGGRGHRGRRGAGARTSPTRGSCRWVALDRAPADLRNIAGCPPTVQRWTTEPRRDLPADHGPRLVARSAQAFVQHYEDDVLDASLLMHAAGQVHRTRPTRCGSRPSTRMDQDLVSDIAASTATTPTASPGRAARRRGHLLDLLVLVRRGARPRRPRSRRRGWPSRRCSPTPTTSACTPRRSARPASSSATSRRPSRTSR